MWQLIMAILDNLNDDEYDEYYELVKTCHEVIERVKQNDALYSLIYSNQPISGAIEKYDSEKTQFEVGNNYMCVYIEGHPAIIHHYFTVIKTIDNNYYLNSSYNSDYVCVPQYTTVLTLNELARFAKALNNDEKYVGQFVEKFFLAGNVRTYYSEDYCEEMPLLKFKKMEPNEGNKKAIEVITRNKMRCGIISEYGSLIRLCCEVHC
jgi:hypothetical protein